VIRISLVSLLCKYGGQYLFATQIVSDDPDFPMRRAQQEITRGALKELGTMP
jgi:hypothetical protein